MRQKGGPNQQWLSWLCTYVLLPPLNRLSWRRLVLIILEEISPERKDDSRRKKERKKQCRFVHLPGIELETQAGDLVD